MCSSIYCTFNFYNDEKVWIIKIDQVSNRKKLLPILDNNLTFVNRNMTKLIFKNYHSVVNRTANIHRCESLKDLRTVLSLKLNYSEVSMVVQQANPPLVVPATQMSTNSYSVSSTSDPAPCLWNERVVWWLKSLGFCTHKRSRNKLQLPALDQV